MAQCYAESKPIGATFDMHGSGFTGRLYCSGFPSYPPATPSRAAAAPELLVPMLRLQQQQQQQRHQQSFTRAPIPDRKSDVQKPQAMPKMPALELKTAIPPPEIEQKHGSKDSDRTSGALAIFKAPEKSSGELAMTKKVENPPQKPRSGEFPRPEADAGEKPGSGKCNHIKSYSVGLGMQRSGSGEIEVPESLASQASKNVGNASSKVTKVSPVSSHQSWPSSPANFRPAPRTRNLSEGSFSMIFPEDHPHQQQQQQQQSSRLYSISRDAVKPSETSSSTKEKKQEKPSTKAGNSPQVSSHKSRSHAGSPPRTSSKEGSSFIRHTRNVSDGNWGALNSLRGTNGGNSSRLNLPTSSKLPGLEKNTGNALKPGKSPLNSEGFNGGFVTGGSFARATSSSLAEKNAPAMEKPPELVAPSFGNITRGLGGEAQKSHGTGNVYLMGESMLLKKALSGNDAEEVKCAGNEQYRKGHFQEALSLYDRAISLCPGSAALHSNRAAALAALGRLGEAVQECEESLSHDPGYSRAHQRLGSLCLRLGWTDDAKRHLQVVAGVDAGEIQRVEVVALHLTRCHEARRVKDWQAVIRESDAAVVAGAESSIQAYALKAEALMSLGSVHEAERVILSAKRLGAKFVKQKNVVDERLLCLVEAEVDLAQGRFDEALAAAEKAWQNEPGSAEVCGFERMIRRVGRARARGNELFKSGKYFDASAAYGEGLELFPDNAVLLCNRAACRSKLRLWEKAIEDCNAALSALPSYTKALLRRAQCHSQLERWENAVRDYEVLKSKLPGDVEVARALFEVQVAFKKEKGEKVYKFRFGGEIEEVLSPEQFKQAVASPGLAVVHFISRWSERCKQVTPFIDVLCKRYPSVNFVKVDIEDHPFLAKTECVATVPTFKVYKNGLKVTEMLVPSQQKIEDAVQHYII